MMNQIPTKILLVEDNLGDAGLLRAALADGAMDTLSFQLTHVERLAAAVALLAAQRFDVVLLDLSLPDARGLESVQGICAADAAVPIVVMSGLRDDALVIEALRMGAQDYLVKGGIDGAVIVRSIVHAIERKRIETEVRRQRERIGALHEINLAITSTLDLRAVTELLLERIQRLLPEFAIVVRLRNRQSGEFETFAARNLNNAQWRGTVPAAGSGLVEEILETRRTVAVEDALSDPRVRHREFFQRHGFVSYLGCPLLAKDELIGAISFLTENRHRFAEEEVEFLTLVAGQAAVAIHNSRLYEQVRESNEALNKALEIKSVLIGVMAHELKNPIQVIWGNTNLLSHGIFGTMTAAQQERLRLIETNTMELTQLIESAVDMARLDGGKMRLNIAEVGLGPLFAELRAEFAPLYRNKSVELEIVSPAAPATIATDPVKLKEILRNLIENGRKFTAQGRVSLRLEKSSQGWDFIVSDSGRGIPADLVPKIFELFYQEDAASREYASAGLGLNIVKRLVDAMAGQISVASEVGKGTTFRVSLPHSIA